MTRNQSAPERTLRIIGGNWRSRKVSFPDVEGIRPTPDRVRETLFNWLALDIGGARCLEPYAGSGILGLEALSRGASFVTFIERSRAACRQLQENLRLLGATTNSFEIIEADAVPWVASSQASWEIALLDPPFDGDELARMLPLLDDRLTETAFIYVESGAPLDETRLPLRFRIHRRKRAGQVHYCLCAAGDA